MLALLALAEKQTKKKMITRHFILYRGAKLSYRKSGTGNAFVLIHGFGENSSVFDHFIPALSKASQLILPDLPGCGASEEWQEDHLSIEDLADALQAILQQENIGNCYMMGHSMGGYITLAFAENFPNYLQAIGLLHSTAYADTPERIEKRMQAIEFIERNGTAAFLTLSTPGLFAPEYSTTQPEVINSLIASMRNVSARTLIQFYRAIITRKNRLPVLQNIQVPLMLIAGEKDEIIPVASLIEQSKLRPNAYFHVIKAAAHMSMLETPDELNALFAAFLLL